MGPREEEGTEMCEGQGSRREVSGMYLAATQFCLRTNVAASSGDIVCTVTQQKEVGGEQRFFNTEERS